LYRSHGFTAIFFLPFFLDALAGRVGGVNSQTCFFDISTRGKGLYEITQQVQSTLLGTSIREGVVTIFIRHTSASLVIFENADPSASRDLESFFERLVPEDADGYTHTFEGPDDMTSHIRMALTRTSEVVPVSKGKWFLGHGREFFFSSTAMFLNPARSR